jgi:predicted PurR-regulated permease PerM
MPRCISSSLAPEEILFVAHKSRSPHRSLQVLTATVVSVVVVACLYWAHVVLVPVALAAFLCFLLTPLVIGLQRRGVPRTLAVVLVVLLAASLLAGMGWVFFAELKSLTAELPKYADNITGKIKSVQGTVSGILGPHLPETIRDISGAIQSAADRSSPLAVAPAGSAPPKVVVEPEGPAWLTRLLSFVSPVLETLAGALLTLVLVIFMLLTREDLRNRVIRLVGRGRITLTTKALDEAGQRISRYLLMQFAINAAYGLAFALGLYLIGVRQALLWGMLACLMRYVPYVGIWIVTLLVIVLSVAMFPGWLPTLLILGLVMGLELVTYNFLEPLLFSQSMGVSEVALLVAAAFWAFLWGPIGLVLSGPLTVCLAVLGKYVPQLEFLDVLLSDERALEPEVSFYQRLSARDQDEAVDILSAYMQKTPPDRIYDDLLLPALNSTRRDRREGGLDRDDEQSIWQNIREIIEDFDDSRPPPGGKQTEAASREEPDSARARILGCPARDEADELALEMFRQLLDPLKWDFELATNQLLTTEVLALAAKKERSLICIASLPPGGLAHTRYICKRLRQRFPKMKIMVGRWGLKTALDENRAQLLGAGADRVTTTLLETRDYLNTLFSVLSQGQQAPSPRRDLETAMR